ARRPLRRRLWDGPPARGDRPRATGGGPMKYRTFRTLVVVGSLGAAAGVGAVAARSCSSDTRHAPPTPRPRPAAAALPAAAPAPRSLPPVPAAPAQAPSDPSLLRPLDVEILHRLREGLTAEKVKDALPGPARVELHRDPDKLRAK